MAPPRPPRRTRSPRAVTVVHFAKRQKATARRTTTRAMPAVEVEPPPEELDEDTAVTAPGEESTGAGEPRAAAPAASRKARDDSTATAPPRKARDGASATTAVRKPREESTAAPAARAPREDTIAAPVPRPPPEDPATARAVPEPLARDAPRGDGLVDVPRDSGGRYHPERVARLLKGQRPGYPFPPLSDDEVTELACFGRFLFEAGRFEDAQLVLEGLVASGVADAFPYSMLGTVYLAQRDLNRALALFEAALALAPADLASHVYRAEIRLRQGRVELAVGDLRYALEHGDPDDPFTARAEQLRRLLRRAPRGGARPR